MGIANLTELLPFLQSLGTKAKKSLSQNFLIDNNIVQKIIQKVQIFPDDLVLEIGPGPGALTEEILKLTSQLIVVEKDYIFADALKRLQSPNTEYKVFCEDILAFSIDEELASLLPNGKKAKVVANLPYQLTSPILGKFLPLNEWFSTLVFMVQEEVAQRIIASPNSDNYSSISLLTQFYSEVSYGFKVSRRCFYPVPKVDSAIVIFKLKPPPIKKNIREFFEFVHSAFQHRRKMLRASLKNLYPPSLICRALSQIGLSDTTRPEDLSLDEFLLLFEILFSDRIKI